MHKWVMPCNWKFPAENFGGDAYHVPWSHLSADQDRLQRRRRRPTRTPRAAWCRPGNGHVLICVGPNDVRRPADARDPGLRAGDPAGGATAAGAPRRPGQPDRRHGVPELLDAARHLAHVPRLAPARSRQDRGLVVGLRRQGRAAARSRRRCAWPGVRGFSPSGTFEQDDMDNWQECTQTCRGVVSRRMPLNTQMGLGPRAVRRGARRWASDFRMSESNHRQFYRRWAQLDGGRAAGPRSKAGMARR